MGMSRFVLTWTLASGLTLAGLATNAYVQANTLSDLKQESTALASEIAKTSKSTRDRVAAQENERVASTKEATGLDPSMVDTDTDEAKEYFADAFSWTSGKEYDRARSNYEKSLGKGNSFTRTYLSDNTKVDTDDGELSYIDFKGLRSTMDDMFIVPTDVTGSSVRYVGFVRYYMKTDSAINNKDALTASEAIVEFTVSGKSDARRVTDVEARQGFASELGAE